MSELVAHALRNCGQTQDVELVLRQLERHRITMPLLYQLDRVDWCQCLGLPLGLYFALHTHVDSGKDGGSATTDRSVDRKQQAQEIKQGPSNSSPHENPMRRCNVGDADAAADAENNVGLIAALIFGFAVSVLADLSEQDNDGKVTPSERARPLSQGVLPEGMGQGCSSGSEHRNERIVYGDCSDSILSPEASAKSQTECGAN